MAYTKQQTFDKVVDHLVAQGKKCVSPKTGNCMYLYEDGSKCAIGCLIPKRFYAKKIEDVRFCQFFSQSETERVYAYLSYAHPGLFELPSNNRARHQLGQQLQNAHDSGGGDQFNWVMLHGHLKRIAHDFEIDPSNLNAKFAPKLKEAEACTNE